MSNDQNFKHEFKYILLAEKYIEEYETISISMHIAKRTKIKPTSKLEF